MSTKGIGYIGSPSMQVSTANQEIIPAKKSHWTHGYNCYKFSFNNKQGVTIILNNTTQLYLEAGQGFEIGQGDAPIFSFVIVESGISYNFVAAF